MQLSTMVVMLSVSLGAPVPGEIGEAEVRKAAEVCLEAIRKKDWKSLARHLDGESLEAFKASMMPTLKLAASPEKAKGGIQEFQRDLVLSLLGDTQAKELIAKKPEEFFPAMLEVAIREERQLFAGMKAKIVGTVREDRDRIHVLYRATGKVRLATGVNDQPKDGVQQLELIGQVTRLGVLTLVKRGEGWKVLVPDEIQSLSAMFTAEWKKKE